MKSVTPKSMLTTTQVAALLGVSRISVFRWIKNGRLRAELLGNQYFISAESVTDFSQSLSEEKKREISGLVDKVLADYGETIRLLGRE